MSENCKLKRDLGHEATAEDLKRTLEEAKVITDRCGCRVVTLIFKPKDDFSSITVVCLRGGRRKVVQGS